MANTYMPPNLEHNLLIYRKKGNPNSENRMFPSPTIQLTKNHRCIIVRSRELLNKKNPFNQACHPSSGVRRPSGTFS